jgi:hypothetical protein
MPIVKVRRQWDDAEMIATYRLEDLEGVRWDMVSGGINAPTPQPFLHGYVQCDAMVTGELAHSGTHGPCPHRIKVCITRKGNEAIFAELSRAAGPKPMTARSRLAAQAAKASRRERH